MRSFKTLTVFALVVAFFAALSDTGIAASLNVPHDLIIGSRLPGDRLILDENIDVQSRFLQIVSAEKTFSTPYNIQITQVEVLDQRRDGTGAVGELVNGGPMFDSVTLKFKSQRNHGIHFKVRIYGR